MAELDPNVYNKLSQVTPLNPVGSIKAGTEAASAIFDAQRKKFEVGAMRLNYLKSALAALYTDPDLTVDKVKAEAQRFVDMGMIPAKQAATALGGMGDNPKAFIGTLLKQTQSAQTQFNAAYGVPQNVDTGGGIEQQSVSPVTGVRPLGPTLGKTLTPESRMATTPGMIPQRDAQGNVTYSPGIRPLVGKGALFNESGNLNEQAAPADGAPAGPAAAPVAAAPAQAPAGAPAPAPTPIAGPGMVTGAPLGTVEAAIEAARGSGQQLAAARVEAADAENKLYPLREAIPLVRKLATSDTGLGSEELYKLTNIAETLGLKLPKNITDSRVMREELSKQLAQNINQNGNDRTNDTLAQAIAGNPNMTMAKTSIENLAIQRLGLLKMKIAQTRAAEAAGVPEKDFGSFSTKFQQSTDPRAFVYDSMSPVNRGKLLKELKLDASQRAKTLADPKSAGSKFVQSLKIAQKTGMLEAQ